MRPSVPERKNLQSLRRGGCCAVTAIWAVKWRQLLEKGSRGAKSSIGILLRRGSRDAKPTAQSKLAGGYAGEGHKPSVSSRDSLKTPFLQARSISTPRQASQAFLWVLLLKGFQPATLHWVQNSLASAAQTSLPSRRRVIQTQIA